MNHISLATILVTAAFALSGLAYAQEKQYGPGVTDTEIKLGNTMPYSGPASALGTIGRTIAAYWDKINEAGGINGRKIKFVSLDDGFSPPKTVEQVRRLVEQEQVAVVFAPLGTAPNSAVQKYLNAQKVPQLLLISAASKWNDPKNYPWSMSMSWGPNNLDEARIHAKHLLQANPKTKVAILYQNDDAGKELVRGFKSELGDKAASHIVAEASFEVTDPTVDSQITTLQGSGADAFMIYSITPKACAQAIRKAYDLGWRPARYIFSGCVEPEAILRPAGWDRATGLIALLAAKQVTPSTRNDPAVAEYLAFMQRYYPEGKPEQLYNVYAYILSQTMEEVLRRCGDDLTRENIMRQAASLRDLKLPMLLPGIAVNTSPTDYATLQEAYMVRFDGEKWVPFGDLLRGN